MILVTGSQGLIGKELIKRIGINRSISVDIALPSFSPGYLDIRSEKIKNLIKNASGIVHLAAVSRVIDAQNDPDNCWDINANATKKLLKWAFESKNKPWFIYASSREVYGKKDKFPVCEDGSKEPMNIYAGSKVAAEEHVNTYRKKRMQASVVRFSSVYGRENDHDTRVIPAFCLAALQNKPLIVNGTRIVLDFTHVTDVISGIMSCIKLHEAGQTLPPIHFVSGKGINLSEAACKIIQFANSQSEIMYDNPRNFDVEQFIGSNERAYNILGWKPKINFDDGIRDFLNRLKAIL